MLSRHGLCAVMSPVAVANGSVGKLHETEDMFARPHQRSSAADWYSAAGNCKGALGCLCEVTKELYRIESPGE